MASTSRRKTKTPRPLAAVTGASAGIGAAFAHALAARGYDLLLIARRRRQLESVAEAVSAEHGVRAEILTADLTSKTRLGVVEAKISRSRKLDVLVNNAGLGDFAPFADSDREREDAEVRLNVLAVVRLCHAALRGMIRRGSGTIINVSSTASFAPCPGFATYGATKAFLNSFTEALDSEVDGTGVRVQALCPGLTHTEIFTSAGADTSALPSFLWMEAEDVVEESLDALDGGPVVFVPGLGNRALANLIRVLPHAATRQIGSVFAERFLSRSSRR